MESTANHLETWNNIVFVRSGWTWISWQSRRFITRCGQQEQAPGDHLPTLPQLENHRQRPHNGSVQRDPAAPELCVWATQRLLSTCHCRNIDWYWCECDQSWETWTLHLLTPQGPTATIAYPTTNENLESMLIYSHNSTFIQLCYESTWMFDRFSCNLFFFIHSGNNCYFSHILRKWGYRKACFCHLYLTLFIGVEFIDKEGGGGVNIVIAYQLLFIYSFYENLRIHTLS